MLTKVSLYVFLVLIYLGASKSLSPFEDGLIHVRDEKHYQSIFTNQNDLPTTLILTDQFIAGLLFKTYYQKYTIVKSYKDAHTILVKTEKAYFRKCKKFLGLSLFDYSPKRGVNTIPTVPGLLFVGDPELGHWSIANSGQKLWRFYSTYTEHFKEALGWGDFLPDYEFFNKGQISKEVGRPYFGLNNEFGPEGSISKAHLLKNEEQLKKSNFSLKKHLQKYFFTKRTF